MLFGGFIMRSGMESGDGLRAHWDRDLKRDWIGGSLDSFLAHFSNVTTVPHSSDSSTERVASGGLDLETRVAVLRALQDNPQLSQRQLAALIGVSLGKTNYCLRALIEKGYVKAENFSANPKKLGYMYQLTPQGLAAKARITARFLKRKVEEHEALKAEIAALQAEVAQMDEDVSLDGALESDWTGASKKG